MRYVLGIDSGGTKSHVRAAALDGTPLGSYIGVPCRHYGRPMEKTRALIGANIDGCLELFGGKREDCAYIMCGAAGFDSEEDGIILHELYRGLEGFDCPMTVVNDAELAHYTVTGGVGVLVIAGTGGIAFGRNAEGETARVGGWFPCIMSDEGSGTYVDAWALHHLSRYLDGMRPHSEFLQALMDGTGIHSRKELMDHAAKMATPPWETPGVGRIVDASARAGDPYAIAILRHAGEWNYKLADELIRALALDKTGEITVGIWGSAILKSDIQRAEMERLLLEKYPQAKLCGPERDAAEGAVAWALERL